MKQTILIILLVTIAHSVKVEQLVWEDNFDNCPNGHPNPDNWGYELGFIRNNELQWYQEDNAVCGDGSLTISAERVEPSSSKGNANYTSSSLTTIGKQEFLYGRFSMKASINTNNGSWPAFWTLGSNFPVDGWPICGEIDIMEFQKRGGLMSIMYANKNEGAVWRSEGYNTSGNWNQSYHTWEMVWSEENIQLYLDGVVINTRQISDAEVDGWVNPFRQPVYIIINQAIGGNAGGDPSNTAFPVEYKVHNVAVSQSVSVSQEDCLTYCKAQGDMGCCEFQFKAGFCNWYQEGRVAGSSNLKEYVAFNCAGGGSCDGANWSKKCHGKFDVVEESFLQ